MKKYRRVYLVLAVLAQFRRAGRREKIPHTKGKGGNNVNTAKTEATKTHATQPDSREIRLPSLALTIIVAAVLVVSGCSLLGGGPVRDADIVYVSPTGRDGARGDDPSAPLKSLAVAVDAVADGGTIKMAAGFYSVSETAFVRKDVTIEGGLTGYFSGPAYDAADVYGSRDQLSTLSMRDAYGQIIHVYGGNADQPRQITVSGVGFRDAFSNSHGAAMGAPGWTDLRLENCLFDNNTSYGKAGALYVGNGGSVSAANCHFEYNNGAWSPAAVEISLSSAVFTNCTFSRNSARLDSSSNAYVVSLYSDGDHTVSFQDCAFEANKGVPLYLSGTATKIDLGGNVGFAPPLTEISAVFTGWTTGVSQATTVVEGPTIDGDESTTVMENSDGSISITSVVNTSTGEGTYTYEFTDYTYEDYTYNGTLTATVSGMPSAPKFEYDGTMDVTGGEVETIDYDYTYENSAFSGTITVNDDYVYDLNADLGL
jgi:hypothetical protein